MLGTSSRLQFVPMATFRQHFLRETHVTEDPQLNSESNGGGVPKQRIRDHSSFEFLELACVSEASRLDRASVSFHTSIGKFPDIQRM